MALSPDQTLGFSFAIWFALGLRRSRWVSAGAQAKQIRLARKGQEKVA
jgi:hypothetical protein